MCKSFCVKRPLCVKVQKGTPWECGFSLHSATTDTAHVPWFSHCFATIDNFCLVFLQWLNKTTTQKKQETKKTKSKKNKQNDKTQLSATTPPLGVCNLVFLFFLVFCFCFFGFLVFWFLVFWFVVGFLKGQGPRPNSLPVLSL